MLGVGVSKDSWWRFITNRYSELEHKQRFITSNSFIVASFDDLDKNQSYSIVGSGKDKSGFHETTIQAVVLSLFCHSHTPFTIDKCFKWNKNHKRSSLSSDIVQPLVTPKNKIDPPTIYQGNKFINLVISDLDDTPEEAFSFNIFTKYMHMYGFTRFNLQEKIYKYLE